MFFFPFSASPEVLAIHSDGKMAEDAIRFVAISATQESRQGGPTLPDGTGAVPVGR